jgi:succinoglycan biosynthesis transport protein ExoP
MNDIGINFQDFGHLLRRRKWLLLCSALAGGTAAVTIAKGLPVHYSSEALLEVEAVSPMAKELQASIMPTTPDQVQTEVDILRSRSLAEAVVRELGLKDGPPFTAAPRTPNWYDWIVQVTDTARAYFQSVAGTEEAKDPVTDAVADFQQMLSVVATDKSHIVSVRVRTGSPELSALVVNTLLKKYLSNEVAANIDVTSQENQWLTEHLAELQHQVDEAASRAEAFRRANNLMDVSAGSVPVLQLSDREQALANAQQDLAKAQADYDTAIAVKNGQNFTGQEALGSPLIQRLREREADVLQRLANLRQRDGNNSAFLRPVAAELDSIRQQIANETDKIVNALGRNVTTARLRVTNLQATVAGAQLQAKDRSGAAATLAQLNQEVEARRHVYTAFLTRMEQTQLSTGKFPAARVVSPAAPPLKHDGISAPIIALFGAFGGLSLAVAGVLLRQVVRMGMFSPKEVQSVTGVTPIGSIPLLSRSRDLSIPMRILDTNENNVTEVLHALVFSVWTMVPDAHCTRVLVTSSLQHEGKTTLAASLARVTAASGVRVLLVEADLRSPSLKKVLGLPPALELEAALSGNHRLADVVQIEAASGLHCLTASGSAANVVKTLRSPGFGRLMDEARTSYGMVVIDSPPVMSVVDPLILSSYADVILFAVAFGTPSGVIAEALDRFPPQFRARIATVLTRVPRSEGGWGGYDYGYQAKLAAPV